MSAESETKIKLHTEDKKGPSSLTINELNKNSNASRILQETEVESKAAIPLSSHSHELKKDVNDTLTESQVLQLGELMKSVCVVTSPWREGTAFRVGSRYLVTAYHVVQCILDVDGIKLSSKNVEVYFGESLKTKINGDNVYRLTDNFLDCYPLDIAILEIANPDENLPPPLHMGAVNIEECMTTVSLIGYGNPKCKQTKHLDPSCAVIPHNSTLIKNAQAFHERHSDWLKNALSVNFEDPKIVDRGYFVSEHSVIISCFLEKGASGCPLIDCRNPRFPQVVGVLTECVPSCYFAMNLADRKNFPDCYRLEVGTRVTSIKACVENLVDQGKCSVDIFNELFCSEEFRW